MIEKVFKCQENLNLLHKYFSIHGDNFFSLQISTQLDIYYLFCYQKSNFVLVCYYWENFTIYFKYSSSKLNFDKFYGQRMDKITNQEYFFTNFELKA